MRDLSDYLNISLPESAFITLSLSSQVSLMIHHIIFFPGCFDPMSIEPEKFEFTLEQLTFGAFLLVLFRFCFRIKNNHGNETNCVELE